MTELAVRPQTREQWLESAVLQLRPLLDEVKDVFLGDEREPASGGRDLPAVRVSVGWPSRGGTASKGKVIGQCWKSVVATDGVAQIFMSPILGDDVVKLLGVLLHEIIHAWDDCEAGHKGRFARTARALGLRGKMTATVVEVGSELFDELTVIAEGLGEYPHAILRFEEMEKQRKSQPTRMLKLECPEDGYIVRTTQKWLDVGVPTCPCGTEMVPA